jgi:hypothetical protein
MNEYDFVYEPDTEEDIIRKKKYKELEDFIWTIEYEDMLIFKNYVKKYPKKFSKYIKNHIKETP